MCRGEGRREVLGVEAAREVFRRIEDEGGGGISGRILARCRRFRPFLGRDPWSRLLVQADLEDPAFPVEIGGEDGISRGARIADPLPRFALQRDPLELRRSQLGLDLADPRHP